MRNVTYHNPIHPEENTPLVTILETNIAKKQSTAKDSRDAPYVVDLAKASFGATTYPQPGSQWYLKKISGVWTLMARAAQQNPQLDPSLTPAVGDIYIGGDGTTHVVGLTIFDIVRLIVDATSTTALSIKVVGDANDRLVITGDGKHKWGDGSGTQDTNLYRSAAGILTTDGTILISDKTKQIIFGSASTSTANITIERAAATDLIIGSFVTGDTQRRFRVMSDGTHQWGAGGSSSVDTNLYRSAADTLKTDDSLVVGSGLTVLGDASNVLPAAAGIAGAATSSGQDTSASGTFVNMAGTGSTTSFSITKKFASTKLRVFLSATFFTSSTASGAVFGVLVNSVDYNVCQLLPTLSSANVHLSTSGTIYITGLAAGSYTVQGRWKRSGGSGTLSRDPNDWLAIDAVETN